MEYRYSLGDTVVLLNGRYMRHEHDVSWNTKMDDYIGRTGKVTERFEKFGRPAYAVRFGEYESWYAEEDWLQSNECRFEESEKLSAFIEEW